MKQQKASHPGMQAHRNQEKQKLNFCFFQGYTTPNTKAGKSCIKRQEQSETEGVGRRVLYNGFIGNQEQVYQTCESSWLDEVGVADQ